MVRLLSLTEHKNYQNNPKRSSSYEVNHLDVVYCVNTNYIEELRKAILMAKFS